MKACTLFGRLQMSRISLGKTLPDIEFGMLGANSRTVHFFRFKPPAVAKGSQNLNVSEVVPDIDDIMSGNKNSQPLVVQEEEETKFGMFFKRLKDKVLPPSLTHDKSNLRVYMDKKLTESLPYIIFPSNNATLIVSDNTLTLSVEYSDIHRAMLEILNRESSD
jgi:hypothetical protein